jgi:hypothetical protein
MRQRLARSKPCQSLCRLQRGASRPRAFGPFGDCAHDDAACEGDGIAGDREALAVAVGPCGSDLCPEGGLTNARDIVDAVGWFGVGGLGLVGHDLLLFPPRDHLAASWEAMGTGQRADGHTPRQRPKGMELHKHCAEANRVERRRACVTTRTQNKPR